MGDEFEKDEEEGRRETRGPFVCPECGSKERPTRALVEPIGEMDDPWSAITEVLTCTGCGSDVPAHLGERWDGLSEDDAEDQWHEVYRRRGRKGSRGVRGRRR